MYCLSIGKGRYFPKCVFSPKCLSVKVFHMKMCSLSSLVHTKLRGFCSFVKWYITVLLKVVQYLYIHGRGDFRWYMPSQLCFYLKFLWNFILLFCVECRFLTILTTKYERRKLNRNIFKPVNFIENLFK